MHTYRGKNIEELRRAELRHVAAELGVSADGSKIEILGRIAAVAAVDGVVELSKPAPKVVREPVKVVKAPKLVVRAPVKRVVVKKAAKRVPVRAAKKR
jgi:hypothetical protein